MALALGTENKRQVILASVLGVVLLDLRRMGLSHVLRVLLAERLWICAGRAHAAEPSCRVRHAARRNAAAGNEAQRLTNAGIDPSLHFDKLAQSEDVEYSGTGRNIFSAESVPVAIPKPIAPVRPNGSPAAAQNLPPAAAQASVHRSQLLRLLAGRAQAAQGLLHAWRRHLHGQNRRHRRPSLQDRRHPPLNVEVTDLAYNNTQTISISSQ